VIWATAAGGGSEILQPEHALDLVRMLEPGRSALRIARHARRIGDHELPAQIVHDGLRHVQRIGQEHAQRPHRGQLQREPQPVMHSPAPVDQRPIRVIEEEDPLELLARRRDR